MARPVNGSTSRNSVSEREAVEEKFVGIARKGEAGSW